mgnify:FL=1
MYRGERDWAKQKHNIKQHVPLCVSEIYAAVRSDIDKSSNAYKLFEYLITASGQKVVKESGYVPIDNQRW